MPRAPRGLGENHERWLVSYADFVTLMFAFFVVLFAYSTVDQTKMESFAARFESYVQPDSAPSEVAPRRVAAGDPFGEQPELDQAALQHQALTRSEMSESIRQVEAELLPEIESGKSELSLQPRGLVMTLRESTFFAPGAAALQAESLGVMARVAQSLTKIPGQIRLEGHTDNTPIHTPRFPSNWRLSTARAITVLKFLTDRHNISSERLAVSGYGEYRPVAPNDTPENRAKNRRVAVVILTKDAAAMEPGREAQPD